MAQEPPDSPALQPCCRRIVRRHGGSTESVTQRLSAEVAAGQSGAPPSAAPDRPAALEKAGREPNGYFGHLGLFIPHWLAISLVLELPEAIGLYSTHIQEL